MRLVVDLQSAQGSSHDRGIGRYSRELAMAMARAPRDHEMIIALNGAMPHTAGTLIETFRNVLPRSQVRVWDSPPGVAELGDKAALRRVAEHIRAQFLASLAPDLVHVASLFEGAGDDVVTGYPPELQRLACVATCFDLIPLIRRTTYFGNASSTLGPARWYYRRLQEMSLCDGLLAISDSSRQEAIKHLGIAPSDVFNIGTGVSATFSRATLSAQRRTDVLARYGLREGFILFLGAGDLRKNEAGLIAAYALLPRAMQERHQLTIVGRMSQDTLHAYATEVGVNLDHFRIVPFVAEADLNALYSTCALFVFPSLHEGFGLPAAEAMACGAPVIASNTSSLPEVVGRADALFDPHSPADIARSMRAVLDSDALRHELAAHGPVQAARFTWERSAALAWDALEHLAGRRGQDGHAPPIHHRVLRSRPRLAFVSPLPPQPTGIAAYARDLAVALAAHYDITLVCACETDDVRLAANFPVIDAGTFGDRWAEFDRIIYHVGNSEFHAFQLGTLMERAPGVVVMHDAFITDLHMFLAHRRGEPFSVRPTLYQSGGYPALWDEATSGPERLARQYTTALATLQAAVGIIQHSRHGSGLYREAFGQAVADRIETVPFLRAPKPLPSRGEARARLGLGEEFVVCSFGLVTDHKMPSRLVDAWRTLGIDPAHGRLVFVGGASDVLASSLLSGPVQNVAITGWVDDETYGVWLAAADVAVQLRQASRGETSAAVYDAISAGLPLVVNAHGSAAELPATLCIMIPDRFVDADLVAALGELHGSPSRRAGLAASAAAFAARALAPRHAATVYAGAIERAYGAGTTAIRDAITRACGPGLQAADPETRHAAAVALARSFPAPGPRRLLVDVSELARVDSNSGIQRVVREMCRRLLPTRPEGYRVELVRFHNGRLRYARSLATKVLGIADLPLDDAPVDAGAGDILLCLDVNAEMTGEERDDLDRLQRAGVKLVVAVYDLLPLRLPRYFPDMVAKLVIDWYRTMLSRADSAVCISRAVADDLTAWLDGGGVPRTRELPIGCFHLGADFEATDPLDDSASPPPTGSDAAPEMAAALAAARLRPTFVMVGTIEPRKGHRVALTAMHRLWATGHDVGLIVIGKRGWKMDDVAGQIRSDPEAGHRLHWVEGLRDHDLDALYLACSALLMPSEAEGFGLPVVEAARRGLPVIARDLPVFREIAGQFATYFSGGGEALMETMSLFLEAKARGAVPDPRGMPVLTWDESVGQLLRLLLDDACQGKWSPPVGTPARMQGSAAASDDDPH